VLFTTTPGRGHYHPMLPLADALAERGHQVAWAAAEPVCDRIRERGYAAMAAGNPEPGGLSLLERYPEIASVPPAERPDLLFAKIFGPERAAPMLDDLLPLAREWSPSVMVCEQAELAGPIVAAALDIPNVTHGFGHPLPALRVARAQEAMQPLWGAHDLTAPPFAGTYEHLYVDIYPEALKAYGNDHIPDSIKVRPHDSAPAVATAGAAPLVYVTFGTVFNRDLDLIATVVEGVRVLPVEVVVTLGPGNEPTALGEQPPNVQVAEFIPQADLLPRCAAVVSHAGSGTFLAALTQGLPQLVLPQAADQFLNASAGVRAGVARAIPPDEITADRVRDELVRVLEDPEIAAGARAMSAEIAAMPSPGDVADELVRRYD
jgi:UDP:flavonoid glycosyltransferase YjiC (YdhE family)